MEIWQVIILALVQGATEFLPVSSTAHLILVPWFFKFPDPGLSFDVAMHLGTFLAVVVFFWHDWLKILRPGQKIFWLLVLATLPAAFLGFLLEKQAETLFRTPILIAATMAIFALVLWWVDQKSKKLNDLNHLNKGQALIIGFSQALALIPGVSRSGITIVGGLAVGLKREAAVKFSFLLSAPIILGASLVGMRDFVGRGEAVKMGDLGLGIFLSFVSGFVAIKFLLKFVEKRSFLPFVIYRLILAAGILIFLLVNFS